MIKLGLIGKDLSYSFSRNYFLEKFQREEILADYTNLPLEGISLFPEFIKLHSDLNGFNVTIPYKKSICFFLDELEPEAEAIQAVNVVKVSWGEGGLYLKGFNSDMYGFENSLKPLLFNEKQSALVLGTGGASSAICRVLERLLIPYQLVSRSSHQQKYLYYESLDKELIERQTLIVNTSPLGTDTDQWRDQVLFPTQWLSSKQLCYDLVYQPEKTRFLLEAEERGARIKNGYEMLCLQAEKAWQIWNDKTV